MNEQVQKLPLVVSRTGKSKSSIYAEIARGTFPPPIHVGPRSVGWLSSEIDAWIAERITASRKSREE